MEAKTGGGKDRGGDRSAAVRESVEAVGIGATAREYGTRPPRHPPPTAGSPCVSTPLDHCVRRGNHACSAVNPEYPGTMNAILNGDLAVYNSTLQTRYCRWQITWMAKVKTELKFLISFHNDPVRHHTTSTFKKISLIANLPRCQQQGHFQNGRLPMFCHKRWRH